MERALRMIAYAPIVVLFGMIPAVVVIMLIDVSQH